MLATLEASTLWGIDGQRVIVEVHLTQGLPNFVIVGQPDVSCKESRERVRAALLSSGFAFPQQRVTINLAPAEVPKAGASLDLPIAIGVLMAMGQIPMDRARNMAFLGELGLDGSLRRIPGVVGLLEVLTASEVVVPNSCHSEAGIVFRGTAHGANNLREVVEALQGLSPWPDPPKRTSCLETSNWLDFADVQGQDMARTAAEIAAAGGHHLLLSGPPGAGKTMIAKRLPGILPPLTPSESVDVLKVQSAISQVVGASLPTIPPFRDPHHTASKPAIVGGGPALRPGEISAAHNGVLFLDEMGEFRSDILDSLRQPLESGVIRLDRARRHVTLPARFLLVGATNPCPCGWAGVSGGVQRVCQCSLHQRERYARRISGPLLDRFDLRVTVDRPDPERLLLGEAGESTAAIAHRVRQARACAADRGVRCNAEILDRDIPALVPVDSACRILLEKKLRVGALTARGMIRIRRVARTIADLQGCATDGPLPADAVYLAMEMRRPTPMEEMAA